MSICIICGKEFRKRSPNHKCCSYLCSKQSSVISSLKRVGIHNVPKGYYVYLWYDNGVPFYVGKGSGGRAWATHYVSYYDTCYNSSHHPCEIRRRNSQHFTVSIVIDGLSHNKAMQIERMFIASIGEEYTLTNLYRHKQDG